VREEFNKKYRSDVKKEGHGGEKWRMKEEEAQDKE